MKKFIYLTILVISIPVFGQQVQKKITVIGEAEKTVVAHNYTITVALQQIMADGYQLMNPISLVEVHENYMKTLKDHGLDFSQFKRNLYYEFAYGYSEKRNTAYYQFSTVNKEDIATIKKLAVQGVSIMNIEITPKNLTIEELANLSNAAIEDAKLKAKALAKKMKKRVGPILEVVDNNAKTQSIDAYTLSNKQAHYVTVVFELK